MVLCRAVKLVKYSAELGVCEGAFSFPLRSPKTRIIYNLPMTNKIDSILRTYIILCYLGFFKGQLLRVKPHQFLLLVLFFFVPP